MEIYEKVVTKEKSLFNELGINLKTIPINLGLGNCQWMKEQTERSGWGTLGCLTF
jgi:hypothetical protein